MQVLKASYKGDCAAIPFPTLNTPKGSAVFAKPGRSSLPRRSASQAKQANLFGVVPLRQGAEDKSIYLSSQKNDYFNNNA